MDVFEALQELKKESSAVDTFRQPLAPADRNHNATTATTTASAAGPRQPRFSRELSSRYKSPTRTNSSISNPPSNPRRCASPTITRTLNPSPQLASKRALSAERKRPTTPTSRERSSTPTSTPVSDTSAEQQQPLSAKKAGSRLPEVLWPSTMRSLSVSFQSDSISIPVSKKEKPVVSHALSDRTLKPSSNVGAQKQSQQGETPRKAALTPERKRSPLKGRNSTTHHHQSENSRPLDGVKARGLIDQHRWPSRAGGGKLSSNVLAKSVDLENSLGKGPGSSLRRLSGEGVGENIGVSLRRLSGEGVGDNIGMSLRRLSGQVVPDNAGVSVRRLPGEGVSDSRLGAEGGTGSISGVSVRSVSSGDGVQDSGGKIPSSPLSISGVPLRRLSVDGVQDSVGKNVPSSPFSSSSTTGVSLRRLSVDGVHDSVGKNIPSSPFSSSSTTGVSLRRLSVDGVQDSVGKNIPSSPFSSSSTTGVSLRRLSVDGVQDGVGKNIPSSPLASALRRSSAEGGTPRTLQKSSGDPAGQSVSVFEEDSRPVGLRLKSVDDFFLRDSALQKDDPLSSSRRASLGALPAKSRLTPAQRLPSPSRIPIIKATLSPIRTRPSTPTQRGGASPSRIRPSTPTKQSPSATSVLSFITDMKKGKKTYQLEDAHQLRLLHNRYLQWRFANAQADAAIYIQKVTAEESLYNVWQTNLELWDSVIMKRIDVQRLKLELKLNSVLREQLAYLEDWAVIERDHSTSLDGAIKDLEASTLRLPVIGGAKVDINFLKAAISSASDVTQAMGSSMSSLLSKVEDSNRLVSELAALAGQERAMLNECDALLASTSAMQLKEYSLRTQLIQSEQDAMKTRSPILWAT